MKPTEQADTPFDTEATAELDRTERYSRIFDEFVRAPVRILISDWRALVGTGILSVYILMGTIGVLVVPKPTPNMAPRLVPAFQTSEAILGTDKLGQSLLSLMVHATPKMFKMILAGAVFSMILGTVLGTLSGYKGGLVDRVIMVITDIMLTIPGLPLVIILGAALKPRDPVVVGLILAIDNWPGLTRALRSQVLTLRDENYVEAERTMGTSTPTILRKDIVPQLMPFISIKFMGSSRRIIFESVGLYFLGVLPFSNLNWGVVMNQAYSYGGTLTDPQLIHWLLVPMFTITLMSLGLILVSQALDRLFNPRIRAKHADKHGDDDIETDNGNITQ